MSSALEAAPAEASTPVAGDSTPAAASSSAEQAASPSAAAEEAQLAQTQQMQSATLSRQASQSSQQAQHPQMAALRKIDALGEKLQKEGKLLEALQCLEKSLILRGHIFGLDSVEVFRACRSVGELCNWLAMSFLQQDLFDVTLELLKKAEVLTERHKAVRAVTFNNLACYYRKRGKLRTALNYGRKALGIEAKLDEGVKSADTHLNLCTILSELKRHEKAMVHARIALKLLLMELFGDFDQLAQEAEQQQQQQHSEAPEDTHEAIATGELQPSPSSASLAELRSKLPPDRVAVLAIAYHNLAVQQEFLRRYSEALVSYEKALRVVRTHLGPDHPLVASLGESYAAAKEKLEGKMARQAQRDAAKQAAAQRQQGTGSSRPTASSSAASLHSSPSKLQLHAARSARSLHVQAQAMALPEEQEAAAAPAATEQEEEPQAQEEAAAAAAEEVEEEAPAEEEVAASADGAAGSEPAEVAEALPSEVET